MCINLLSINKLEMMLTKTMLKNTVSLSLKNSKTTAMGN
jgi:hypothetical protein